MYIKVSGDIYSTMQCVWQIVALPSRCEGSIALHQEHSCLHPLTRGANLCVLQMCV